MIASIAHLDTSVLMYFYAARTLPVTLGIIRLSELGGVATVVGLTLCAALLLRRHRERVLGLFVAVGGASVSMETLKHLIARARPPIGFQAYTETGYSLPSGHATGSMALYGFLWWLAWSYMPQGGLRTATLSGLPLLILAIGFSRVYLGVHYLSDVLCGFALGAAFVWLGVLITQWREKRALRS